jgi:microcystin-dependent protein
LGFTLTAGKTVCFIVNATNASGVAVTLNVNATGATNFFRQPLNAAPGTMVGGELVAGAVACAYYDGTQFQCTNCNHPVIGTVVDYTGVSVPSGWAFANGQALSRTTYAAAFSTISNTTVSATTTITSTTVNITGANTFLQVGWYVGGSNVTCNSTISSVAANSIVISSAAGASGATTLTIGPYTQGDCSTTFNVPNLTGRTTAHVDGVTNITAPNCANSTSLGAACGGQSTTLAATNLPTNNYTPAGAITVNSSTVANQVGTASAFTDVTVGAMNSTTAVTATFAGTPTNIGGSATAFTNLPPLVLVYKIMKL